ncbi:cysteine hydrolase [Leptolyngbya sp. GB1-A1]|uniref:cysteine hydrolase family protein n=1 Tax=Leptolyngbya sp. GB1-A1 TaxID=2933908 RepID=UPI00329750B9
MTLEFDIHSAALLVIDFQQDFLQGGVLQTVGASDALLRAERVLAVARAAEIPIIHTREVHREQMVDFGRELDGAEPVHCLENHPGTDFHPALYPIGGEFTLDKRRYSAFFATDLDLLLRGLKVDTLIMMGTLTNVCVHYTAVDAHQHDYFFYIIEDCCVSSDWNAHWSALKAMEYLQQKARITHSDFVSSVTNLKLAPCIVGAASEELKPLDSPIT